MLLSEKRGKRGEGERGGMGEGGNIRRDCLRLLQVSGGRGVWRGRDGRGVSFAFIRKEGEVGGGGKGRDGGRGYQPRQLLRLLQISGGGEGGGGGTQFVHGRSRMTIDPRIPTMPGRSTSGFHQPDIACTKREAP